MKSYLLQDFAAAEEKALGVGAKKFFLQVRTMPTICYEKLWSCVYDPGSQTWVHHRTYLPSRSGQLYLWSQLHLLPIDLSVKLFTERLPPRYISRAARYRPWNDRDSRAWKLRVSWCVDFSLLTYREMLLTVTYHMGVQEKETIKFVLNSRSTA